MSRVLAIAGHDLGGGLGLAGIEVQSVPDAPAARDALLRAINSQDYGLVIVEERFVSAFDEQTRTMVEESNRPLIISVPADMTWRDVEDTPRDDTAARLIRRAVGYQLNISV